MNFTTQFSPVDLCEIELYEKGTKKSILSKVQLSPYIGFGFALETERENLLSNLEKRSIVSGRISNASRDNGTHKCAPAQRS